MKKSLIVEIFLFIILLSILAFLGMKVFKHTFDIGTTYHVAFNDIDSIVVGSPVRILGVDIGHVCKIQTAYDKIYVDFIVTDDKVKLPPGTKATIAFFGIAGSRSIELTPPEKGSEETGIVVRDPIRIGDAFGIMEEFLRATMVSIAGLYQFAKNRTQGDVENVTAAFLRTTNESDDKIEGVTGQIVKGGAKLHGVIKGTTTGMSRIYDETKVFNLGENVYRAKYAAKMTKHSLVKVHRNIKNLNKNMEHQIEEMKLQYGQLQNLKEHMESVDDIDSSLEKLSSGLDNLYKNLTQENLDKVYNSMEDFKVKSLEIEKSIK